MHARTPLYGSGNQIFAQRTGECTNIFLPPWLRQHLIALSSSCTIDGTTALPRPQKYVHGGSCGLVLPAEYRHGMPCRCGIIKFVVSFSTIHVMLVNKASHYIYMHV